MPGAARIALLSAATVLAATWAAPRPLAAHDFQIMETLLVLKANGHYQVDLTCDLDALALGVSPTADSEVNAAALRALDEPEMRARLEQLR